MPSDNEARRWPRCLTVICLVGGTALIGSGGYYGYKALVSKPAEGAGNKNAAQQAEATATSSLMQSATGIRSKIPSILKLPFQTAFFMIRKCGYEKSAVRVVNSYSLDWQPAPGSLEQGARRPEEAGGAAAGRVDAGGREKALFRRQARGRAEARSGRGRPAQ